MERAALAIILFFSVCSSLPLQGQSPRANVETVPIKLQIDYIEPTETGYRVNVRVSNQGNRPVTLALATGPDGLKLQSLGIQQWDDAIGWESVGMCRDVPPDITLTMPPRSTLSDVQPIFDLSKLDFVTTVCPRRLQTLKGRVRAILYFAYASQADFVRRRSISANVTSEAVDLKSFAQKPEKATGSAAR